MIPKIIHYVWLGNGKESEVAKRCIASWNSYLPEYKIIKWNENNWDLTQNRFAYENYMAGKYAYASDVIRLDVLNKYGGIYLDSDVMINKSFNELLDQKSFWGMMYNDALSTAVIGSESNNKFIQYLLELYGDFTRQMIIDKKIPNNNNGIISKAFIDYYSEFMLSNKKQLLSDGTVIFPKEYFEFPTYKANINYSEHLFTKTWSDEEYSVVHNLIRKYLPNIIGNVAYGKIRSYRGEKRYRYLTEYFNQMRSKNV